MYSTIGCTTETLRSWVLKAEASADPRRNTALADRERIKQLERENAELKRANEILRKASAFFCPGGARPPREVMLAFYDALGINDSAVNVLGEPTLRAIAQELVKPPGGATPCSCGAPPQRSAASLVHVILRSPSCRGRARRGGYETDRPPQDRMLAAP